MATATNRGVAYMGPGKVELHEMPYPELALGSRRCDHGVILKTVATNICGSDQHMVRGRTTAPEGLILGHEITGEVIEAGRDVEFIEVATSCPSLSTSPAAGVGPARKGRRASVST